WPDSTNPVSDEPGALQTVNRRDGRVGGGMEEWMSGGVEERGMEEGGMEEGGMEDGGWELDLPWRMLHHGPYGTLGRRQLRVLRPRSACTAPERRDARRGAERGHAGRAEARGALCGEYCAYRGHR